MMGRLKDCNILPLPVETLTELPCSVDGPMKGK